MRLLWRLHCNACQFRPARANQPFSTGGTPKVGIQFMNHADPRLQHEITHLLHFSMHWKSWTVNARSYSKNEDFFPFFFFPYLLMLSGTTHFTLILWIERRLGAGVWGNGSEKKNGKKSLRNNFILNVSSLPEKCPAERRSLLFSGAFLCFALISVVKFYDTDKSEGGVLEV